MKSIVENATSLIKPQKNPYLSEKIWEAYDALPQSGIFPYLSITNTPEAVKFVLTNFSNLFSKNISIAGSLVEPLHWLEQVSLYDNYQLLIKTLSQPFRSSFFMKNINIESTNSVDIIVLVEYFSSPADLNFFNSIEAANPGLSIEYWVSDPSVKNNIEEVSKNHQKSVVRNLLLNKHTILNLCKREKSINSLTRQIFNSCEIFKRIGYIPSRIWWNQMTSFANSISGGITHLLVKRKPKVLLLTDDTKLYGSLAAKIARQLNIPSILVPHALPTPFYFPLICDYQTVWGRSWMNALKNNKLSEGRIWITGDLAEKPKTKFINKKEKLKLNIGSSEKKVIGYFASPAEENNSGVFATINAASKLENTIVIVRGHPRHKDHAKSLEDKLKGTSAIYIPFDVLEFDEFCCVCDVVATFESTALLYAIRYDNYGFQVNLNNTREPENNYNELANLKVAYNENEIIDILSNLNNGKYNNSQKITYENYGEASAKCLFDHIKGILKGEQVGNDKKSA